MSSSFFSLSHAPAGRLAPRGLRAPDSSTPQQPRQGGNATRSTWLSDALAFLAWTGRNLHGALTSHPIRVVAPMRLDTGTPVIWQRGDRISLETARTDRRAFPDWPF